MEVNLNVLNVKVMQSQGVSPDWKIKKEIVFYSVAYLQNARKII